MQYFAADTAATTGGANLFTSLWPIGAMFLVLYFLLIRPQQKRQKARKGLLNTMKKGDKVVTIGGLHGTIMEMDDDTNTVVLRVNDATKLTFDRSAINTITQPTTSVDK
jgi:preprotein translocase subunit YajC